MRRDRLTLAAAAALLALFAGLSAWEMSGDSLTADERVHLPAGYAYWTAREFRLNPEHPPLVKLLCAAPLLPMRLVLPSLQPDPGKSWRSFQSWFGTRFLFSQRRNVGSILLRGRVVALLIGIALLVLLFQWSRELHGHAGAGLVTLLLAALEPTLLAHGHYVTDDVGLACFSVMAMFFLWRLGRTGRRRDLALASIGMGLALATKFSATILLPPFFYFLWRRLPGGDPRRVRIAALLGAALAMAAIVQASYLFSPDLGLYFKGLAALKANRPEVNPAYIHGRFFKDMVVWYPLYAWLLKTPLPTLAVLGVAAFSAARRGRRRAPEGLPLVLAPAALLLLAVCLLAYNYGVRYLIPVTSFLLVFAGGAYHVLGASWRGRLIAAALGAWLAASVAHASPHYIGYFNELVGGPANGLYYLQDSNIDWGQDLKRLARYQEENRIPELALGYWGPGQPEYYGIRWRPWTFEETVSDPPPPGVYAASVNDLIALKRRVATEGADPHLDWLILVYRFPPRPAPP
ncbi:MAG: hypothetical protein DMF50_06570 [Acidobacteria bacterium]|nr:MAG: hypothetical protein DMF50_06570 [Acidobacteriota bacterium]